MNFSDIILIINFLIWMIFNFKIFKRDILFGGIYFFLYVYTVFGQIGYSYFPEISSFLGLYFEEGIIIEYNLFVLFSFISLYYFFKIIYLKQITKISFKVYKIKNKLSFLIMPAYTIFLITLIIPFFIKYYDELTYANYANDSFQKSLGYGILLFGVSFKLLPSLILIQYAIIKFKINNHIYNYLSTYILLIFILLTSMVFYIVANKIGNRTDIVSLIFGILSFEYYYISKIKKKKLNIYKMLKFGLIAIMALFIMSKISSKRSDGNSSMLSDDFSGSEKILVQDFYTPCHMLYASINFNLINPIEVFKSNFSNSLFLLKYPLLQTSITSVFREDRASRSSSFALYIFTEGFMVMGFLGFIYNGLVLNFLILLWRKLSCTNNLYINSFVLALTCERIATAVRSQSAYFIKDIYMFFIPAIIIYSLTINLIPNYFKVNENLDNRSL